MNRPIGVFDSGLGGLTVFKEIIDILPNENVVYFGDTQRVPYGSRSRETIIEYTFQAINFLISKNVKVVVIACNTATAMALDLARKKYSIPIIGVIKAGSKTVVNTTKNNIIGVIGTDATIKSNSYSKEINNLNKDITVIQSPCPLFVPIVEEGWANTEIARLTAKKYLDDLINKDIDSLVLGCTHYPILQKTIKEVTKDKINLVNPAKETAKELIELLKENNSLNNSNNEITYDYYVSDTPQKFLEIAYDFLNIKIETINTIDIKNY